MRRMLMALVAALLPSPALAQALVMPVPLVGIDAGLQTVEAQGVASAVATNTATSFYGMTITLLAGQGPGFIMIWDATTVPAPGTVSPKRCWYVDGGPRTTTLSATVPLAMRVGVAWGFSTGANCQTFTPATANFVAMSYKQQRPY
jgi:hypothetical protein